MFIPLYIDPGTGSMLFSLIIGLIAAGSFGLRALYLKFKFVFSGGNKESHIDNKKIPYLIFSDHKRYWNIFKPICNEFEKRGVDLVYWTASPDDPALSEKYEHVKAEFIGEGNKPYARLNMMNAGIVLATTPGLDVLQWKRSKNVQWYVHILHMISDPIAYRMFGLDFYDSLLLSGSYQVNQIQQIENMRKLKGKELKIVGCTYMDTLYARKKEATVLTQNSTKTILVAPTWGQSGILSRFGEKIIDALLKTGYSIVIRPHPQSFSAEKELLEKLQGKYANEKNLSWNRDNDNFDILNKSDLMISDFSGVVFDYALVFEKPVIYVDTNFDSAPYDAAWLDDKLWTFKVLPKLGCELKESDFPNIKDVMDNLMKSKELRSSRTEVIAESWSNIGESAKLTVDYLINKQKELNSKAKEVSA